ncbi:phosphatase PAP2 family protein [Rhizobium sp.]|uniref:phosphatase PAP2 family protein n=1 Tax=Rhizobium sp. TaxID=391 RepID=UPI0039170238
MKHFPTELRSIARVITDLGKGQEVLVLSGLIFILGWLIPARLWPKKITVAASEVITGAAFVFLSVAGGGLVAALIKNVIGRARPGLFETYGYLYFRPFAFDSHFASFPSGHSA